MKRCSMCGEDYDERVDFCFSDGTPLDLVVNEPATRAANIAQKPEAAFDGLDAPDPENLSGIDAPEPGGFAAPPARVDAPPAPREPVASSGPSNEEPGRAEERQSPAASGIPVGFFEPPSSASDQPVVSEDSSESDGDFDELDFPEGFAFGDGDFLDDDLTEPTVPAPRSSTRSMKMLAAALVIISLGLGAIVLRGGGDEVASENGAQEAALGAAVTADPVVVASAEVPTGDEPEADLPAEDGQDSEALEEEDNDQDGSDGDEELPDEEEEAPSNGSASESPASETAGSNSGENPGTPWGGAGESGTNSSAAENREHVESGSLVTPDAESDGSSPDLVDPWGTPTNAPAPSMVRIYSKPAGARVFVDGRRQGSTPSELELDRGSHSVRVEKDGYFSESRTVDVNKPSHLERFRLKPESQRVTVNCYGPDSSKVYLDGQVVCAIPGSGNVSTGRHEFRVVTPDRFFRKTVNVQARPDGSAIPLRFND